MKAFDHDKPASKDEWVFSFVNSYRELRPEIGEKFAKTHAVLAYRTLGEKTSTAAAKEYFKRSTAA